MLLNLNHWTKRFFAVVLTLAFSIQALWAQVEVNVSGAKTGTKGVAVVPFQGDSSQKIDFIVSTDLKKSGFFQPIDPKSYQGRPSTPQEVNNQQFQAVGAEYVVLGRLTGQFQAQISILDIANSQVMATETVQERDNLALAHKVADIVLQHLTGKRGIFGTRIAYVLEQGQGVNRSYSLVVSGVDSANKQVIYRSPNPILSPAWSPNGSAIAFATYENNRSAIVIQTLGGGRRVVAQNDATSSSPAFSPDGRELAYVQSDKGQSNIFVVDLGGGGQRQLTNHASINTEPAFSPDGRSIYFTSDRSGNPQIYRVSRGGGNASLIKTGNAYSASSNLSPDGQLVAITRQNKIGTYNLQSGQFQVLTNGRLDEGASFSPNSEMIIYASNEGGRSVLKVINSKGGVAQTIADPSGRLRDPAWAPDTRK